jgi:hypothetical protein
VIEYLTHIKMDEIYEYFKESKDIFEYIKEYYNGNKKIVEVCNAIFNIYNQEERKQNINQSSGINLLTRNNKTTSNNLLVT